MAPKRNIYIKNEYIDEWDNIPSGKRSKLIQRLLHEHKMQVKQDTDEVWKHLSLIDELVSELMIVLEKSDELELRREDLFEDICEYRDYLNKDLGFGNFGPKDDDSFYPVEHHSENFSKVIISNAKKYTKSGKIIPSITSDNLSYKIIDVDEMNITIQNLDSNRVFDFPHFTYLDKAVKKFNDASGWIIRVGRFIPTSAWESLVVELHPNLRVERDWIIYHKKGV